MLDEQADPLRSLHARVTYVSTICKLRDALQLTARIAREVVKKNCLTSVTYPGLHFGTRFEKKKPNRNCIVVHRFASQLYPLLLYLDYGSLLDRIHESWILLAKADIGSSFFDIRAV
jgi:hypothetical protein